MSTDDTLDRAALVREILRGGWWRLGFVGLTVAILSSAATSCVMQPQNWSFRVDSYLRQRENAFRAIKSFENGFPAAACGIVDLPSNASTLWQLSPPETHVRSVASYQDWQNVQRFSLNLQRRDASRPIDLTNLSNHVTTQLTRYGFIVGNSESSTNSGSMIVPGTQTHVPWSIQRWSTVARWPNANITVHATITILPDGNSAVIEWNFSEFLAR